MRTVDGQESFLDKSKEIMELAAEIPWPIAGETKEQYGVRLAEKVIERKESAKFLPPLDITLVSEGERVRRKIKSGPTPIKSTGGSSGYYQYKHPKYEELQETEDFIEFALYNDFDLGNINKTTKRVAELAYGTPKEGSSMEYELNKIDYSVAKLRKRYCK